MEEKIDERWNRRDLPVYNTLEKKGFIYHVDTFGDFHELVPLKLVRELFNEKDTLIRELRSQLYNDTFCACGDKFEDHENRVDGLGECSKCDCVAFRCDETKTPSIEKLNEKMDKAHDIVEMFNKNCLKHSQISALVQLHELLSKEGRNR